MPGPGCRCQSPRRSSANSPASVITSACNGRSRRAPRSPPSSASARRSTTTGTSRASVTGMTRAWATWPPATRRSSRVSAKTGTTRRPAARPMLISRLGCWPRSSGRWRPGARWSWPLTASRSSPSRARAGDPARADLAAGHGPGLADRRRGLGRWRNVGPVRQRHQPPALIGVPPSLDRLPDRPIRHTDGCGILATWTSDRTAGPPMGYAGDVGPSDAYAALQADADALLVDVRTAAELIYVGLPDLSAIGKRVIPLEWQRFPDGALNESFVHELREAGVDEGAPIYFLCRSGVRSAAAAKAATAAGLGPAYNVSDGFEGPLGHDGHRTVSGLEGRRTAVEAGMRRAAAGHAGDPRRPGPQQLRRDLRGAVPDLGLRLLVARRRRRRPSRTRSTASSTRATATPRCACSRSGCGCWRAPRRASPRRPACPRSSSRWPRSWARATGS